MVVLCLLDLPKGMVIIMADKRSEEISDFDEDEEAGTKEKGKKKKSKEKAPKDDAQQPHDDEKGKKRKKNEIGEKKKLSKLLLILIIVAAFLILVAGFGAVVYFDLFGMGEWFHETVLSPIGDWLLGIVIKINPEFRSVEDELREKSDIRQAELDFIAGELETRSQELDARAEAANNLESELDRRNTALDRREEQLRREEATVVVDKSVPLFRRDLTEQERTDLQSISRSYTQMSPEAAAEILAELPEKMDVATIIYFMAERNAASILTAMDPEYAAEITNILINN